MQFIDAVGQQVRPLQALPAPDRIVDIERHVLAPDIAPAGGQLPQIRLLPGKPHGRPSSHCCARGARRELGLERGAVAGAPHLRARRPLPCVREEPSAEIVVKPIQVRGQVRQVP